ncbi:MAG: HlyD family type I secretion periplasmic adaptor subunit [Methyloprofundus sp.]|nr:HlyD family type I secretion periplasmic adaptor subunit [Methyloprofundus sp.]
MTDQQATTASNQTIAKLPRARARFLAQAIQLEEQGVSGVIKLAIYFSLFLLIVIIFWASQTSVNEVTIARGEAVPSGYIHDIQHLEGGIVSEIAVRNGDLVKPGELLIRFAQPVSQADFDQLQIRKATLTLNLERVLAIDKQRRPDFGAMGQRYPDLASKAAASHHAQVASVASELNVLKSQTNQRKSELRQQQNQVAALQKEIKLLQEQVDIRAKLTAKHVVSQTELLSSKSQLASAESELKSIIDGIQVASMALQEAKHRRIDITASHKKDIEFEVAEYAGQLAEVEKSLIKAEDRVNRLNLFSPIAGIIQGIAINSINAVVQPGNVILQIIPVDSDLVVEARIMPDDVGHISIDQPADVKVDSYDAGKFGYVSGKVQQISASTYLDEKMNPYYLAHIELEKNYVGDNPERMKIIPGMTVQVSIITGSKTILDYLMKPVSRGFKNAFQER